MADEAGCGPDHKPPAAPVNITVEGAQQAAVLKGAIVVDPHRDKDDIPIRRAVEIAQHVIHQAKFRHLQPAVFAETALGKDRLADALPRGHVDIPLQHFAVQRIAGTAPDKKGAHGSNQHLQGPDFGPLSDCIGQRGPFSRQKSHQNVIHIRTVVHNKNNR